MGRYKARSNHLQQLTIKPISTTIELIQNIRLVNATNQHVISIIHPIHYIFENQTPQFNISEHKIVQLKNWTRLLKANSD